MNNFKSCVPCVCTSSCCNQICERHDIGAQSGATATNTATKTVETLMPQIAKSAKSAKFSKTLKVAGGSFQFSRSVPKWPRWLPSSSLCAQQGVQMEETSISEHSHPRTSHHPSHDQGECHGQAQHHAWFSSKWNWRISWHLNF